MTKAVAVADIAQTPLERLVVAAREAPANAYLLVGASGQTLLAARALATSLMAGSGDGPDGESLDGVEGNPEAREIEASGEIETRRRSAVSRGVHPDCVEIEPAGSSAYLMSQVQDEILLHGQRRPLEASRKVILLTEAEALTPDVASTLLKTLEEPGSATTFILCAQDETVILDTIVSRCVTVTVPPLSYEAAGEYLASQLNQLVPGQIGESETGSPVGAGAASDYASLVRATGSLEFAQMLAADARWLQRRIYWLTVPARLAQESVYDLAQEVNADFDQAADELKSQQAAEKDELASYMGEAVTGKKKSVVGARTRNSALSGLEEKHKRAQRAQAILQRRYFLATLAGWYRDVFAVLTGAEVLNPEADAQLRENATNIGVNGAVRAIDILHSHGEALAGYANAQFVVEDALLELKYVAAGEGGYR